jgi:hypothetical protein
MATSSTLRALASAFASIVCCQVVSCGVPAGGAPPATSSSGVDVVLGRRASDGFSVRDRASGIAAHVSTSGARTSLATARGDVTRYADAFGPGAHLEHRARPDGTEDFVRFPARPDREELRLSLDPRGVAGLRMVPGSGALELLDAGGTPRLRMEAPYGLDADGRRFSVSTRVEGCAVDESPAPPWGRPPTPLGGTVCGIVLSWGEARPAYPVTIDPAWTTTASMATARAWHTATLLADGRLLVAGGADKGNASAELFDPATSTWATVGPMKRERASHTAALLPDGRAIVVGGGTVETELFDPVTGTFSSGPPMHSARSGHSMVETPTGALIVVGGTGMFPGEEWGWERMSATLTGWSVGNAVSIPGYGSVSTLLADGRVLVAGGDTYFHVAVLATSTNTAMSVPLPLEPRDGVAAAALADGSVLLIGGGDSPGVDRCVPSTSGGPGTLSPAAPLLVGRSFHRAATGADGSVLVVGGRVGNDLLASVERFDPATGAWASVGALQAARVGHTLSVLQDGSLIVTGGQGDKGSLSSVERCADGVCAKKPCAKTVDCSAGEVCSGGVCTAPSPNGFACAIGAECSSGVCQQGVCCATLCAGDCISCNAKDKSGSPSGVCGSVTAGGNPFGACKASGGVCGAPGVCDAAGACLAQQPVGHGCPGDIVCTNGVVLGPECDGKGACVVEQTVGVCHPARTCDGNHCGPNVCTDDAGCVNGYACIDGRCQGKLATSCSDDATCASGHCALGGICCDQKCDHICETCNGAGTKGTCTPLPAGKSSSLCDGTPACICLFQTCNGIDGIPEHAAPGTSCAAGPACNPEGTALVSTAGSCDGKGVCEQQAPVVSQCFPYRCHPGESTCATACTWGTCAAGAACESGVCVRNAPITRPAESGGCGCRVPNRDPGSPVAMALVVAAWCARRWRRSRL